MLSNVLPFYTKFDFYTLIGKNDLILGLSGRWSKRRHTETDLVTLLAFSIDKDPNLSRCQSEKIVAHEM